MNLTLAPEEFGTAMRTKTNRPPAVATEPPSLPEGEPRPSSYTQWTRMAGDQYFGVGRTYPILPAGLYFINRINNEPSFTRIQQNVDELLRFPDSVGDAVLDEIDTFWQKLENFRKYNVLHRRGYLFYGPAGSGKSCLIQQIVADIIARGGIVFLGGHPGLFNQGLHRFREIEPHRKVVCLFEDIESMIENFGESEFLSLLDGENQIDQVLNIASTNYPERLDRRIVRRPRRFDRIIKVDMPTPAMRRLYFEAKLKLDVESIALWVARTDGFSFAACAELLVSVKCLGNDFDQSVETIKALCQNNSSSAEFNNTHVGFQPRA